MTSHASYVLEVSWTYDHHNTEYATLTVEGTEDQQYESGFEILVDPEASKEDKHQKMEELKDVAHALRRQAPSGSARLVRLYRVVDHRVTKQGSSCIGLNFVLKPICSFDTQGIPFPPNEESRAGVPLPALRHI